MEEKDQTEISPKSGKKPKWMKVLEKQSWQAELVISGAAIFGALQLPEVLRNLVDFCIYHAPEQILVLALIFITYLAFVIPILIINFILHFVLRALWIGMLGLVSVFPNGINYSFESWSEDYGQKVKKEFPDINQFNQQLDNLCSIIFSGTSLGVMMFVSISIVVFAMGMIAYLLNHLIPVLDFNIIFLIIFFSITVIGMLQGIFISKRLREKAWVQKIHFPIYKLYAKLMFTIFYRPINYINLTLSSNTGIMKSLAYAFLYFFVIGIFTLFLLETTNHDLLANNTFHRYQNSPMQWDAAQYKNTLPNDTKIFGPIIQSDKIVESEIELFIPRFAREQIIKDSICSTKHIYDDKLSSEENEKLDWENRIDCHNRYYKIYLNDSLIRDIKFYNINYPNKGERGFLSHISTKNCKQGENILKVVLGYRNPRNHEQKMFQIPFRYVGD